MVPFKTDRAQRLADFVCKTFLRIGFDVIVERDDDRCGFFNLEVRDFACSPTTPLHFQFFGFGLHLVVGDVRGFTPLELHELRVQYGLLSPDEEDNFEAYDASWFEGARPTYLSHRLLDWFFPAFAVDGTALR